jgi:hypothetical protein
VHLEEAATIAHFRRLRLRLRKSAIFAAGAAVTGHSEREQVAEYEIKKSIK